MTQSEFDETKAVAHLPNIDIEIVHRQPWQGDEELLTITLRVVPSFDAFFRAVEAANPFHFWLRAIETAWAPWLRLGQSETTGRLTGDSRSTTTDRATTPSD
jgi:hypothetical protein